MHVLQWIAIKDESKEDALAHVRNNLESYMNDGMWYDWFIAGGGRWNPNSDPYFGEDSSMVMSAEEVGNEEFIARVNSSIESRMREFNDYRQEFAKAEVDINAKFDSYDGTIDYSFELYPLRKMLDMIQGDWDFNSYYFDMEHHSTNPKHLLDKLEQDNVNWYLVPVDFHF